MSYIGSHVPGYSSKDHGGFSTGYDLWQGSPLEPELYRESVSPLATKIVDKGLSTGQQRALDRLALERRGEERRVKGLGGPDWNVGLNRLTNSPGPLYRVDDQQLETQLAQENQVKWDELDIPIAPALPAEGEGVYGPTIPLFPDSPTAPATDKPITDFVSNVTNFVSEKPVTTALIVLGAYIILR